MIRSAEVPKAVGAWALPMIQGWPCSKGSSKTWTLLEALAIFASDNTANTRPLLRLPAVA